MMRAVGAPDEVLGHDVGVGLEGDAAAFDRARVCGRRAAPPAAARAPRRPPSRTGARRRPRGSRRRTDGSGSWSRTSRSAGSSPSTLTCERARPISSSASRSAVCSEVGVLGVAAAARKGDLAGVAAQVGAAPGEHDVRLAPARAQANSGTSTAAAICSLLAAGRSACRRAGCARASGGQVNALNALLEHDLAVERAVHRALRGDHAQALDLILGQIVRQPHHELELRRAAALGRAVLDVHLDVADVPALALRRTSPS